VDPFVDQLKRLCAANPTRAKWIFVPTHAIGRTLANGSPLKAQTGSTDTQSRGTSWAFPLAPTPGGGIFDFKARSNRTRANTWALGG
jgi:hypothetical protein